LKDHITNYYKQLFGRAEVADMHLDPDLWHVNQQIQQADNVALTRPFWLLVKEDVKEMMDNLFKGQLEL
jgi:hypothetical protein